MPKPALNKTIQLQPSLPCGLESCITPLHPVPKKCHLLLKRNTYGVHPATTVPPIHHVER
jgi:hypothetical protein